jgi:hypothetical protein
VLLPRPCLHVTPADITNHWLPMWLAPNLITLLGVFALLLSYFLSAVYLPEFAGSAPLWVYFFRWAQAGCRCRRPDQSCRAVGSCSLEGAP